MEIIKKPRNLKEQAEIENTISVAKNTNDVSNIVFVELAKNEAFDETTIIEHSDVFLDWQEGIAYKQKDICKYNEDLYKCLQDHTSQEGWNPTAAVSLWKKIGNPTGEYPEWSQPIGAGDAYMMGDKVSFEGKHYISTIDNNVWSPAVYGWNEEN